MPRTEFSPAGLLEEPWPVGQTDALRLHAPHRLALLWMAQFEKRTNVARGLAKISLDLVHSRTKQVMSEK